MSFFHYSFIMDESNVNDKVIRYKTFNSIFKIKKISKAYLRSFFFVGFLRMVGVGVSGCGGGGGTTLSAGEAAR